MLGYVWQTLQQKYHYWQSAKKNWSEWDYLVLDMETSHLDAKQGHIVSVGWVCIRNGRIDLDSARHILLEAADVSSQIGIHLITDEDIESQGKKQLSVLRYLRHLLRGKILVMHHAPLELSFLKQGWKTENLAPFPLVWLDTLAIERHKSHRAQQPIQEGGFRLGKCRERYGLPDYQGHDALTDALATAELLLAQVAYQGKDCQLQDLNQLGGGQTKLTAT
ncbi:3'-5' exonuclease [Marinomonas dokdonensis]|uniref:3'-5' exonuclease n=1 Tax=Marinomonas dokdonensis TaxID=328224 RepID=UPI0040558971